MEAQWNSLHFFKLPPPTKRLFAMEFADEQQPDATEKVPAIKEYLEVDPRELNRMHRRFNDALNQSKPRLPDRSTVEGIPDAVVTGAFTGLLEASWPQREERRALIEGFRRELRPNAAMRRLPSIARFENTPRTEVAYSKP